MRASGNGGGKVRRMNSAAFLLIAATLLTAVAVQAQPMPQRVNVPFKFNLVDKAYPASMYYFRYEPASNQLEVMGREKTLMVRVPVVTRLAQRSGAKDNGNVRLVFDQVGEERYLSEVWFPSADGLLIRATAERHKHEEVDAAEK
jgi:hypothetical protein